MIQIENNKDWTRSDIILELWYFIFLQR